MLSVPSPFRPLCPTNATGIATIAPRAPSRRNDGGNPPVPAWASDSAGDTWNTTIRLRDPDGQEVASASGRELRAPIPLAMLGKSRDPRGEVRNWTLEISPRAGWRSARVVSPPG